MSKKNLLTFRQLGENNTPKQNANHFSSSNNPNFILKYEPIKLRWYFKNFGQVGTRRSKLCEHTPVPSDPKPPKAKQHCIYSCCVGLKRLTWNEEELGVTQKLLIPKLVEH